MCGEEEGGREDGPYYIVQRKSKMGKQCPIMKGLSTLIYSPCNWSLKIGKNGTGVGSCGIWLSEIQTAPRE